jgi:hypothetical protein
MIPADSQPAGPQPAPAQPALPCMTLSDTRGRHPPGAPRWPRSPRSSESFRPIAQEILTAPTPEQLAAKIDAEP